MEGKDVEVERMPFELRPYPTPRLKPNDDYVQHAWSRSVKPLAKKMGIDMNLPAVSPMPYTRLAFEGLQFARENGLGEEYHQRVFSAYYQEGLDIGKIEVLSQLADEVGLDKQQFSQSLQSGKYEKAHQSALQHANEEAGINVVPTIIIGKSRLQGLHSKEALEAAIKKELSGS